jgi:hypothetical protein
MARNRAEFERFCRSLTPDELRTQVPGAPWTVHDYIAHLATIDALIAPWLGAMAGVRGMPAPEVPPPVPFDIDDWNELIVERRRDRSVEELLVEAAETRANLARAIEALTDEKLDMMIPYGGDRKVIDLPPVPVQLGKLLYAVSLHDMTHTMDIIRALPEREPDVREWLASGDFSRVPEEVAARRV